MYYRLTDAKYVSGYTIWCKFSGGLEGEADLTEEIWGPIFEPLKNI